MSSLLAYHGDPAIKEMYLARVRAHRAADELVKGVYWEKGKGCAVGCTIHSSRHADYETLLGVPRMLARLEDTIFEGLASQSAQEWPEAFLSAIPVGADLSLVGWKFLSQTLNTVLDEYADEAVREIYYRGREIVKARANGGGIGFGYEKVLDSDLNTEAAKVADRAILSATGRDIDCAGANAANAIYFAAKAAADAAHYTEYETTRKDFTQRVAGQLLELLAAATVYPTIAVGNSEVSA